ncbi:hypothetical protein E2C01_038535 [Portunus trituberculatus]|uniref:Uncharacterized protein n=1 Tax=Portunus trituberculatus TaxID=210409 RepID=A0A5B7FI88_PORTR|nr:hypothetical protein [Portunus trituberculatus]
MKLRKREEGEALRLERHHVGMAVSLHPRPWRNSRGWGGAVGARVKEQRCSGGGGRGGDAARHGSIPPVVPASAVRRGLSHDAGSRRSAGTTLPRRLTRPLLLACPAAPSPSPQPAATAAPDS